MGCSWAPQSAVGDATREEAELPRMDRYSQAAGGLCAGKWFGPASMHLAPFARRTKRAR